MPATSPASRRSTSRPCSFTLCNPDVAFPAKVAFSALGIFSTEQLEETGGVADRRPRSAPVRTSSRRGSGATRSCSPRNEDYWGDAPPIPTVVFRWSEESAQRLVELQSGGVDGIDNVGTEDFATVEDDSNLQLLERDPLNVFYLGINVDKPPFDNEMAAPGDRLRHRQGPHHRELLPGRARRRPTSSSRRASPATRTGPRASPTTPDRARDAAGRGRLPRRRRPRRPELPGRGPGLPAPAAPGRQRHP